MEDGLLYVIMSQATSFVGPAIGLVNRIKFDKIRETYKEYCEQRRLYNEGLVLRPSFFEIYMETKINGKV